MNRLSKYKISSADWRSQLRRNQVRTRWVIFFFLALYIGIGLLVDLYLNSQIYRDNLDVIFNALITLKITPYATIIMAIIAAFSLLITYSLYNRIMLLGTSYHEVKPDGARTLEEKKLYNVVEEMKVAAGLKYIPRVYIIDANYMNAFASGYSEKSAMVAITRGLMEKLDRDELQAVMAHELSHIRHQDIKLTLTASVLSNIMLIVVDLLFYNAIFSRRRSRSGNNLLLAIMILRFLLPIITVLLMLYLSRTREYMADAGCVELMRDNQPLGRALLKIQQDHSVNKEAYRQEYGNTSHEEVRRAAYLYDPVSTGSEPVFSLTSMFSTHPDVKARLEAIGLTESGAEERT